MENKRFLEPFLLEELEIILRKKEQILQELNGQKGFVIAPFRVSEMCPVILIQSDGWGQSLSLDDDTEEEYEASLQIQ